MLPISWPRFLAMWTSLALLMSANGILREALLKRVVSSRVADVLSAMLGIVLIVIVTRIGFSRITTRTTRSLLFASAMLVLLTIVFETALGIVVDHKTITQLLGHYAIWNGELWPVVLAFLAFTPFLWAHRLTSSY